MGEITGPLKAESKADFDIGLSVLIKASNMTKAARVFSPIKGSGP